MERTALIYQPAKTAMQSGRGKTKRWILEFISPDSTFVDPTMGWIGSRDTTRQLKLIFESQAEAIEYAQSLDVPYVVREPREKKVRPKSYAANFAYDRRSYSDVANQLKKESSQA